MVNKEIFRKYTFRGHTGYLAAPWLPNASHDKVAIRHSSNVEPWADEDVHIHKNSEEYYFLRSGKLWLVIDNELITLEPNEYLQVRENIPHAVVKGQGEIEHFVIRIPAKDDKKVVGKLLEELPQPMQEKERELQKKWGYRVSIKDETNRDCWLFGIGQAKFHSSQMCLAFMNHPTQEIANEYEKSYHHCFHAHQKSWEFYTVLKGAKTLRVEDEYITINAGDILEVPPGVKHVFHKIKAPFEGFTFRTPLVNDKVEYS